MLHLLERKMVMENNMNVFNDKDLYTIAVMRYKEENPNLDIHNLFSMEWNLSHNYKLKNNIIAEALEKHVLVEETELYKKSFTKRFR